MMVKCSECANQISGTCRNISSPKYLNIVDLGYGKCSHGTKMKNPFEISEKIIEEKKEEEKVNHPSHYNQGIEAIDIIESWGLNFSLGNAIKYILRAPHKGNQVEDLEKAIWYLNRELERIKKA